MTPKQKAEELVDKFISYSYYSDGNNSMERNYQQKDNAKECALIAVDEILSWQDWMEKEMLNYWEEVKKEIEKL
jgi:hypothetical protein